MGCLLLAGRPPQRGLDAIRRGAEPRERRGEAREGDHPFCRVLKKKRCPKNGDTRAEGFSPCPGAVRCAAGSSSEAPCWLWRHAEEEIPCGKFLPLRCHRGRGATKRRETGSWLWRSAAGRGRSDDAGGTSTQAKSAQAAERRRSGALPACTGATDSGETRAGQGCPASRRLSGATTRRLTLSRVMRQ